MTANYMYINFFCITSEVENDKYKQFILSQVWDKQKYLSPSGAQVNDLPFLSPRYYLNPELVKETCSELSQLLGSYAFWKQTSVQ